MYLKDIINNYFKNYNFIGNENGQCIDKEKIIFEYEMIKKYLYKYNSNDVIGIHLEQNYKYLLTVLACMEVGLTYVPLSINWPTLRVKKIIELANIKCTISNDIIEPSAIKYSDLLNYKYDFKDNKIDIFDSKPLYIIFTSGSTGEPKGVVISRKAYSNYLMWISEYYININKKDRILALTDFTFDVSLMDVGFLLTKNVEYYFLRVENNIFSILRDLDRYKITLFSTVPNNLSLLLSSPIIKKANLSCLNTIILGGARFSYGTYMKIIDEFPNSDIYNIYGPTEATVYCFIKKLSKNESLDIENHVTSIGNPIMNCNGKIINNNIEVDNNVKGELYLSGIQLMNEYLNDTEKTNKVLCNINGEQYYKSGDFAYRNFKGEFFIVGRLDDTIKTAGHRVNLSDVDSYIQRIEEVSECATIAVEDEIKENILIAYMVLNSNYNKEDIYEKLTTILPLYQMPSYIEVVESFPLNNSGKICKKSLKNKYLKGKK